MIHMAATVMILLHGPGGREIMVNPDLVVSMHAAVEGEPNKIMADEVRCLINTSDGKFISVIEDCELVTALFHASVRRPK